MIRRLAVVLTLLAGTAAGSVDYSAGADSTGVEVRPGAAPRERVVSFHSTVLARETSALVILPNAHPTPKTPTIYFLPDEQETVDPRQQATDLGLSSSPYIVVIPDAGATRFCSSCGWVDGIGGGGIAARTYLTDELVPVVERALHLQVSRDARAVAGLGMGGTGAVLAGLKRPDVFGSVAALSPRLSTAGPYPTAVKQRDLLRSQGFDALTPEAEFRDEDALAVASSAVNTGVELLVAVGPRDSEPDVVTTADAVTSLWTQLGLAHTYLTTPDAGSGPATFRAEVLPRLGRALTSAHPAPRQFSYTTTARAFSIWDYRFGVTRPNSEFFNVLGARTDGRALMLAGTGVAAVVTPAVFEAGSTHRVVVTPDPKDVDPRAEGVHLNPLRPESATLTADGSGRLHLNVKLGPDRTTDERQVLLDAGKFPFSHVRVEVDPKAPTPQPTTEHALPDYRDPAGLPQPFSDWTVSVRPATSRNPAPGDQVLSVIFESPRLGTLTGTPRIRTENYVFLPDSYRTSTEPLPVVYFLHGTGCGYCNLDVGLEGRLRDAGYVVIVPDVGQSFRSWCFTCDWVNGRDQAVTEVPAVFAPAYNTVSAPFDDSNRQDKVLAEDHLYNELMPLMEGLFRIRSDRAGRGIDGNSMGAGGALLQAFRHPDRFSFVGGLSGLLTLSNPAADAAELSWFSYLEYQGYPPIVTKPILFRGISVSDLGSNVVGTGLETLITTGDGCMSGEGHCSTMSSPDYTEPAERRANDPVASALAEQGVAFSYPTYHGVHYWPDREVYASYHVPRIEATFADAPSTPQVFGYKSVDRAFSIWGYDVAVQRPNDEFVHLLGARSDGSDVTIAGTGRAQLKTPARFAAGRAYAVEVRAPDRGSERRTVIADSAGRLILELDLGPTRDHDERLELVAAGLFRFPQTRVTVLGPA